MDEKLRRLEDRLRAMERVVVAYSGGVDSSLLLKVAHDCLGEGVVAVVNIDNGFGAAVFAHSILSRLMRGGRK